MMICATLCQWHLWMGLDGAAPLIWCAFTAADRERQGKPWGVMELAAEYAAHTGETQWQVYRNMQTALRRCLGPAPAGPGEALEALVAEEAKTWGES
jgi:hypothetical protein